jgi:hypothetical protein
MYNELLDQLLAQVSGKDAESLLGEAGLIGQLKKQLAERMWRQHSNAPTEPIPNLLSETTPIPPLDSIQINSVRKFSPN